MYKSVQFPTKFVFRFVRFYGGDTRLIAAGCARRQRSRQLSWEEMWILAGRREWMQS